MIALKAVVSDIVIVASDISALQRNEIVLDPVIVEQLMEDLAPPNLDVGRSVDTHFFV